MSNEDAIALAEFLTWAVTLAVILPVVMLILFALWAALRGLWSHWSVTVKWSNSRLLRSGGPRSRFSTGPTRPPRGRIRSVASEIGRRFGASLSAVERRHPNLLLGLLVAGCFVCFLVVLVTLGDLAPPARETSGERRSRWRQRIARPRSDPVQLLSHSVDDNIMHLVLSHLHRAFAGRDRIGHHGRVACLPADAR